MEGGEGEGGERRERWTSGGGDEVVSGMGVGGVLGRGGAASRDGEGSPSSARNPIRSELTRKRLRAPTAGESTCFVITDLGLGGRKRTLTRNNPSRTSPRSIGLYDRSHLLEHDQLIPNLSAATGLSRVPLRMHRRASRIHELPSCHHSARSISAVYTSRPHLDFSPCILWRASRVNLYLGSHS